MSGYFLQIVLFLVFFNLLPSACQKNKTNQTKVVVKAASQEKNTLKSSDFFTQKAFKIGEGHMNQKGEYAFILSKLQTENEKSLLISDEFWNIPFDDETKYEKVVYFSTESRLNKQPFKNIDFSEMKGFAFAPLVMYLDKLNSTKGKSWFQHYLHLPENEEPRTIWKKENATYFLKPPQLKFNPTSNLPQFYHSFPNYSLPKNKISANSFRVADVRSRSAIFKGSTFIGNWEVPLHQQVRYDYDEWLYASGCPAAYSTDAATISKWLENVDEKVLMNNFFHKFYNPLKDYGYVVMDFEALGDGLYGSGVYKIEKCFEFWRNNPHKALLGVWGGGGIHANRVLLEAEKRSGKIENELQFNGNFDQWQTRFSGNSSFFIKNFITKYVDVFYIGGYMNTPNNYGYIQHLLIENSINKKFFKEKKNLVSWWHNIEFIGNDYQLGNTFFKPTNEATVLKKIKPIVFPEAMFNTAVWAFTMADGGDLWSEPYARTDDTNLWGIKETSYTLEGKQLPNKFGEKVAVYAEQNFQNIDWWEAGKWAVSQNKEIIEGAKNTWSFVPTQRENGSWTTEKTAKPHFSLDAHTPLAAAKLSDDNKKIMLLVYDAWNDPLKKSKISCLIKGKTYEIDIFGRFTSVVSIDIE